MTLKDEYEQKRKELLEDSDRIESASSYKDGYLKWGSGSDSSGRSLDRMRFVRAAEREFLENNMRRILMRAAEMCREYANGGRDD